MFATFECGCKLPLLDDKIKDFDGVPSLKIDFENIDYNCQKTWALFHEGKTKGIFQLETNLGRAWSKRTLPSSLDELSILIAILRPGCLKAIVDGKSMTQRYADRKLKAEEVVDIHASIHDILAKTQQVLVFQEQAMQIAQKIAGFDLKQADILRRAAGKKDAQLMTEVENMFLEGVKNTKIVTEEEGRIIWDCIRKSERYSFNASHSLSYSILGYWSAYVKAHFPIHFYCSWLTFAKEKIDPQKEVRDLISDAKSNGVEICVPSLLNFGFGEDFSIIDKKIFFGPRNIKRVGASQATKLSENMAEAEIKLKKQVKDWSWHEFLVYLSGKVSKTVVNNIILVGALDHFRLSRKEMLHEYNLWSELTEKEQDFISQNVQSSLRYDILYLLENGKVNKNRQKVVKDLVKLLESPTSTLEDTPLWINKTEEDLLGVAISARKLDACETVQADTTCKEYNDGKTGEVVLCVEIKEVREYATKKGKNPGQLMAFLVVEDDTDSIDNCVLFSKEFEEYRSLIYNNNVVAVCGYRSKQNSLVINKVKQL